MERGRSLTYDTLSNFSSKSVCKDSRDSKKDIVEKPEH